MTPWQSYWIFLFPDKMAWFPGHNPSLLWNFNFKLPVHVILDYGQAASYRFSGMLLSKWPSRGHICFFGFQTRTLIWHWISTLNSSSTLPTYMGRGLFNFQLCHFLKKWPHSVHIEFLLFSAIQTLILVWLWITTPNFSSKHYLCVWVETFWFSVKPLLKWSHGCHIGYFGFRTLT